MIKYISIFWLVLRCLLVARKENLTGFSTGLIGRSKNLDPTGRLTRLVSICAVDNVIPYLHLFALKAVLFFTRSLYSGGQYVPNSRANF